MCTNPVTGEANLILYVSDQRLELFLELATNS